jgi:protein-L-isoaspartate(D-aspartate) O-methyltransferase
MEQTAKLELAREQMVECQVRPWEVLDARVLDLMATLPRERFVPERYLSLAFSEASIPLGNGQLMMAPKVEGRVLQAVGVKPGEKVLEIGTGSGYLAACLAELGGEVLSVDINEAFVERANAIFTQLGIANARAETRDGSRLDWAETDYDVIVVTGSMPQLHDSFLQRLGPGGRLFVILGREPVMDAVLYTRIDKDDWSKEYLFETEIPPLVNAWNPKRFEF